MNSRIPPKGFAARAKGWAISVALHASLIALGASSAWNLKEGGGSSELARTFPITLRPEDGSVAPTPTGPAAAPHDEEAPEESAPSVARQPGVSRAADGSSAVLAAETSGKGEAEMPEMPLGSFSYPVTQVSGFHFVRPVRRAAKAGPFGPGTRFSKPGGLPLTTAKAGPPVKNLGRAPGRAIGLSASLTTGRGNTSLAPGRGVPARPPVSSFRRLAPLATQVRANAPHAGLDGTQTRIVPCAINGTEFRPVRTNVSGGINGTEFRIRR